MAERIAVTGLSLVCGLGNDPQEVTRRLLAGDHCLKPETISKFGETREAWVGRVSLDLKEALGGKGWRNHNRAALMACLTGKQLQAAQGKPQSHWNPEDIGLVMGFNHNLFAQEFEDTIKAKNLNLLNPAFFLNIATNAVASQVTIYLHIHAFAMTASTGFLAGLEALDQAVLALRANRARLVWAGAAEETIEKYIFSFASGFISPDRAAETGALLIKMPGSIPAGEGSALLQLQKASEIPSEEGKALALVEGFGMGVCPEDGQAAMERAIQAALQEAGLSPRDIGALFVAANGNAAQDQAEARAVKKIFGERVPPGVALKGALGETYHAHGALSSALAIPCLQQGQLPPTVHMADSEWARLLNLSLQARAIQARYALILAMEQDRKAAAFILSLPGPEAR